jgi:ppGpp synthetase/RelA/SpoT-type nucleotidyltranferase/Flp pilus assembly protein TadD
MAKNIIESIEEYKQKRPLYESFCNEVKRILIEAFNQKSASHHTIEARAKTVDSFARKSSKFEKNGTPKYSDAISQITDLAAVRVIVYTLSDVERACQIVDEIFKIEKKTDVGEERIEQGKFGYQSIHYLIRFTDERSNLLDFQRYKDLICEIQVRTVLQHAWAEIEHDIQYKSSSDLPRTIERKFLSLAGLIEIADREFQSIQDEDARIKAAVRDDLKEELTLESLEATTPPKRTSKKSQEATQSALTVREFVSSGNYEEAVKIYSKKIEKSPKMDTLYLGRAKAKFLMGERSSAIDDLNIALGLNPNSSPAKELIGLIQDGSRSLRSHDNSEANELTKAGHEFLERGDGIGAYEKYSAAVNAGASRPFSTFNKAMACVVANDLTGAQSLLETLRPREGTPMAINAKALGCVIEAVGDRSGFEEEMKALRSLLDKVPDYSFPMSPLRKLENALPAIGRDSDPSIAEIFEMLRGSG